MKGIDPSKAETPLSAGYTTAFANAVLRSYDKARKAGHHLPLNFLTQHQEEEKQAEDEGNDLGAAGISFKGKVKPMIAATLRLILQNLGHPPNRELIRHLRRGGAGEGVIRAAEKMQRKTCAKHSKVKSARVAQPSTAFRFQP